MGAAHPTSYYSSSGSPPPPLAGVLRVLDPCPIRGSRNSRGRLYAIIEEFPETGFNLDEKLKKKKKKEEKKGGK
jgi:hypothetical protein